jgi:dUTP pyrophosphatase
MLIKVKKLHPSAVLPSAANETDAGFDLVAIDNGEHTDTYVQYRTGIAIEVPPGYHTEIFPRSSVSKMNLVLANSIGVVDEGYRGEIMVRFKLVPDRMAMSLGQHAHQWTPRIYKKGERIAQLLIRKTERAEFEWSDELSDTARGTGGLGSTGQ